MGRKNIWHIIIALILMFTFMVGVTRIWGADFPRKPVNLIVPTPAGSGMDTDARGMLAYLEKYLGVRVTIENIPGADSKIGLTKFWKSKPDGYTLLIFTHPAEFIHPRISEVEYKSEEFVPVYLWTVADNIIVVPPDKWKTFQEFVKEGRERTLVGGAPARGAPAHFDTVRFITKLNIKIRWVPFRGAGESITALAGGHLDFSVQNESGSLPLVRAGKIRPLLVMADERSELYPDVPSAKELGFDVEWAPTTRVCYAPPKTPQDIVKKIDEAFGKAVKDPGFLDWAKKANVRVHPLNSQQFAELNQKRIKMIDSFMPSYRKVLQEE
jgi:tripartite-type tricarboxylate transporter receptor subunit TctC